DHLGSTTVTANGASGERTAELWYKPWGESRGTPVGATPTTYRFTGQREDASIGLYFYNARYYDSSLGRFIQGDTIVPGAGNPQNLNRYSYVGNNALRYTDPTGHVEEGEAEDARKVIKLLLDLYGILIDIDFGWQPVLHPAPGQPGHIWVKGGWELADLETVQNAVGDFAAKAGGASAAHTVLGGVTIRRGSGSFQLYSGIELTDSTFNQAGLRKKFGPRIAVVHELAHYWDWKTGGIWSKVMNTSGALVDGMTAFVGMGNESAPTLYGQKNAQEEWAESVAMYVYPEYEQILLSENNPLEVQPNVGRPGLGPLHAGYVKAQFGALSGRRGWR
ncbi:MAG: RHS repeat-associated core domain-containing protein, partial [Anaerolineae bacterium]